MNTIAKNAKISNALTVILLVLTTLQGFISNPPFTADEVNLYSPILLLGVAILGFLKNYFAPDVNSSAAKWPLIILTAIGIFGALNQYLFEIVQWSEATEQKLRLLLTAIIAILSALSKTLFPTAISLTGENRVASKYEK